VGKLSDIQNAFTARIRDPQHVIKPVDIADDRMQVYKELLFNNIEEALNIVFPICKHILGSATWLLLVRKFMSSHAASKPLYTQISEEFVEFLLAAKNSKMPAYLSELTHYE
jgi:hypothetical protein